MVRKVLILTLVLVMTLSMAVPAFADAAAEDTYHFTVVFKDTVLPTDVEGMVQAAGGSIVYTVPAIGVIQVVGTIDTATELLAKGSIRAVSPSIGIDLPEMEARVLADEELTGLNGPGLLYHAYQWDIKRVTSSGQSWALNTGDHGVVVGIIDTGVDYTHPDLIPNLLPGSKNFVPAGGYLGSEPYEAGDPSDVTDRHSHGSHVAGSIAGNGWIYGVGPDLGFRAYKVFGASSAFSEWIWAAMIAAADDGVDVINMSLGGYDFMGQIFYVDPETGEKTPLGNDAAYYVAYTRVARYCLDKGVTIVASAGNDAINATIKKEATDMFNQRWAEDGLPYYVVGATFRNPGGLPGVVTVSATSPTDELSSYSTYGPGYVTVAAPGGDFMRLSDGDVDWYLDLCLSAGSRFRLRGPANYMWMAGTSMAAPKAAAVAALIIAEHGDVGPEQVVKIMMETADDLGRTGTDQYFGHGLVNAFNVLSP